jgi:hypothetical protein
MRIWVRLLVAWAALIASACASAGRAPLPTGWYQGNTHTHTLWSDGDGAPEVVARWYKSNGYHFLVLSDHNLLSEGEKWKQIGAARGEVKPEAVPAGSEVREREEVLEVRLRTHAEVGRSVDELGRFLLLQGEEISDQVGKLPVHHTSINHQRLIKKPGGATVKEALDRAVAVVEAAEKEEGRPMLVTLNHPNFQWGVSLEDVLQAPGERFLEIYNGHRDVRNYGDEKHPGAEQIWDAVLAHRLSAPRGSILYGVASDDTHNCHKPKATANPGRGWICVRASALTAEALFRAMREGDFYASTGVMLEDVKTGRGRLSVRVAAEPGVTYRTRFVGTRRLKDGIGPAGEVLAEVEGPEATYAFRGDELYVRAVVVSSRPHPNPFKPGDLETAWIQPVAVEK